MNSLPSLAQRSTLVVAILACFNQGICATPAPVVDHEIRVRAAADQLFLQKSQEPLLAPLDLADVLARTFKYGLDLRLRQMDGALNTASEADIARPERQFAYLTEAGYTSQNRLQPRPASLLAARRPDEQARPLQPLISSNDLIDLALHAYRARHTIDAQEAYEARRQRVMQTLGGEVSAAYWRALGAQKLNREAEALQLRLQAAFIKVRESETSGGISAAQALDYQRALHDLGQTLSLQQKEFAAASKHLARLMQLPAESRLELAEAPAPGELRLSEDSSTLENHMLQARRDLPPGDKACTTSESCRQLLFPLLGNLNLDWSPDLLKTFLDGGPASADLVKPITTQMLRLLVRGGIERHNELRIRTEEARGHTLRLAAIIQLQLGLHWLHQARQQAEYAMETAAIEHRLTEHTVIAQEGQAEAELKILQAQTRALGADYQAVCAQADLQTAIWRVQAALGQDIRPGLSVAAIERRPLAETAKPLREALALAERAPPLFGAPPAPAVSVYLDYPGSPQVGFEIEAAAVTALRRAGFAARPASTTRKEPGQPVLTLRLTLSPIENGVRPAQWTMSVASANGSEKGSATYNSVVAPRPDTASLRALAESGINSQIENLGKWLAPARQ